MNKRYILVLFLFVLSFLFFYSCEQEDYPYYIITNDCRQLNPDIPSDPGGNPPELTITNVIPSGVFSRDKCRIKINMLGIIDPSTSTPITLAYKNNIWVTEDGILKGLKVTNLSEQSQLLTDIVFTIDNSGSMGEEADSIAFKIKEYIDYLQSKGLNVRVGVLGYIGRVNGGINLTDGTSVKNFLSRPGYNGTMRTLGFVGSDSAKLQQAANSFGVSSENGIVAIWFADSLFNWRSNAARVYINFTDEGIQPGGNSYFSTNGLQARWASGKGTIHSVFSIRSTYWSGNVPDTSSEKENMQQWNASYERPWGLSVFSGGTIKFIHSDASDLDLKNLPVTGALTASALVEYISDTPESLHNVTIYVKHGTTVGGKTEFKNIKY